MTAIFETSLEVMISVFGETPKTGQSFHCADAYATVVVVDGSGNPMSIPFELQPSTDTEKLRYEVREGKGLLAHMGVNHLN